MHRMPASSAAASSSAGLADAGEHDLLGRNARSARALQLAARHDVRARAEPRQRRDHRLIGIRLHGVADERGHVGERLGEHPVVPRRASRSNSSRTACRPRRAMARKVDLLGVHHAVAIGKVVHGQEELGRGSRSASRGMRLFWPWPGDRAALRIVFEIAVRWRRSVPRSAARRRIERALAAARRHARRQRESSARPSRQDGQWNGRNGSPEAPLKSPAASYNRSTAASERQPMARSSGWHRNRAC